eukprot:TRINITY_DN12413_c0_g1_i3.p1 TRINITY_DN12413_c0_g1~~TRINITY_DN12413_c0_g1_i3.p1  ORF type:complete len:120 (+),score=36.63 TRINITY_DN12413_c0_g1_i3:156-515(+)
MLRSLVGSEMCIRDSPKMVGFHMTRHGHDRFMRGAYSASRSGAQLKQMDEMSAPLWYTNQSAVFFGGEHTCDSYSGYLHGGYNSGKKAAGQVLAALGRTGVEVYHGECDARMVSLGLTI